MDQEISHMSRSIHTISTTVDISVWTSIDDIRALNATGKHNKKMASEQR